MSNAVMGYLTEDQQANLIRIAYLYLKILNIRGYRRGCLEKIVDHSVGRNKISILTSSLSKLLPKNIPKQQGYNELLRMQKDSVIVVEQIVKPSKRRRRRNFKNVIVNFQKLKESIMTYGDKENYKDVQLIRIPKLKDVDTIIRGRRSEKQLKPVAFNTSHFSAYFISKARETGRKPILPTAPYKYGIIKKFVKEIESTGYSCIDAIDILSDYYVIFESICEGAGIAIGHRTFNLMDFYNTKKLIIAWLKLIKEGNPPETLTFKLLIGLDADLKKISEEG